MGNISQMRHEVESGDQEAADRASARTTWGRPATRAPRAARCRSSSAPRSRPDGRRGSAGVNHPAPPPCASAAREHGLAQRRAAAATRAAWKARAPSRAHPSYWPSQMSVGHLEDRRPRQRPGERAEPAREEHQRQHHPAEEHRERAAQELRAPLGRAARTPTTATRKRSPKLTTTASTTLTENAAAPAGSAGSADVEEEQPDERRRQPAGDQVVRRATQVAGEVPADQPGRPVEVDGHVAGRIRSARSSVVPPPHRATVISSAWPSQT